MFGNKTVDAIVREMVTRLPSEGPTLPVYNAATRSSSRDVVDDGSVDVRMRPDH
jgi:hypothetical protein